MLPSNNHIVAQIVSTSAHRLQYVLSSYDNNAVLAGELEGDVGGDLIEGVIDGFLNGSVELQDCHAPKPVLLASGEASTHTQVLLASGEASRYMHCRMTVLWN